MKKTLSQKVVQLKEEIKKLEEVEEAYGATQINLDNQYQKVLKEIGDTFQGLREGLVGTEAKLKSQLRQFYEGENVELGGFKVDIGKEKEALDTEIKQIEEKIEGLGNIKVLEEVVEVSDYKPKKIKNPTDPEFPILELGLLEMPKI